jgi:hypothetical protein
MASCYFGKNATCILNFVLQDGGGLSRQKPKLIRPVWAQKIESRTAGDVLLVTGWGHLTYYPEAQSSPAEDLLERLRRYQLRHIPSRTHGAEPGLYQFADATDDSKLVAFVEEFGPIWGEVRSSQEHSDGTATITVAQDFNVLRREQQIFASTVRLIKEVNQNSRADPKSIAIALAIISSPQRNDDDPSFFDMIANGISEQLRTRPSLGGATRARLTEVKRDMDALRKLRRVDIGASDHVIGSCALIAGLELTQENPNRQRIVDCAHGALCRLFNGHFPLLVPYQGQTIELPCIAPEGIREALYFQLRLDYQAQRAFGTCLNCGGHFPIRRKGARACGELCRRALRNQKYWNKHSKAINSGRMMKRRRRK